MDPPHITEFASERYFSKLNQLRESGSQDGQLSEGSTSQTQIAPLQSKFILPLRASNPIESDAGHSRTTEPKRTEKNRIFSFRKVPLLASRTVPQLPENLDQAKPGATKHTRSKR
jgi:hypothetical protein